jgi:hypothetical protein
MQQPIEFYNNLNELKKLNWIDNRTMSVLIVMNFYSPSTDFMITARILYENFDYVMKLTNQDYAVVKITEDDNWEILISLIFSLISLLCFFLNLRQKLETKQKNRIKISRNVGFWDGLIRGFKKITSFILKNFRRPTYFEWLSKIML